MCIRDSNMTLCIRQAAICSVVQFHLPSVPLKFDVALLGMCYSRPICLWSLLFTRLSHCGSIYGKSDRTWSGRGLVFQTIITYSQLETTGIQWGLAYQLMQSTVTDPTNSSSTELIPVSWLCDFPNFFSPEHCPSIRSLVPWERFINVRLFYVYSWQD